MKYDKEEIKENIEDFKRNAFDNFVEEKKTSISEQINSLNNIMEDLVYEIQICKDYGIKIQCVEQREIHANFKLNIREVDTVKRNLQILSEMIIDIIEI